MSRLVEAVPRAAPRGEADPGTSDEPERTLIQQYGERVAKYVPAEVLAFYTGAVLLVGTDPSAGFRFWAYVLVFLVGWFVTPWWLGRFASDLVTKRANQITGFVAFLIWAYAYPAGVFVDNGWYRASVGGLLLLFFTLGSGFYQPKK